MVFCACIELQTSFYQVRNDFKWAVPYLYEDKGGAYNNLHLIPFKGCTSFIQDPVAWQDQESAMLKHRLGYV